MEQMYSVLMSVYKKEKASYLKTSIESMIRQTVKTNDFVLVCDGKLTNELNQVISYYEKKYPDIFHIIRLDKNYGLGYALNIGLAECRNELVARMDSDDIARTNRCELQLTAMREMKADIVSGTVREFINRPRDTNIFKILPEANEDILVYARKRNPINHPTVMMKKSKVEQVGGYKPFYLLEDYYLWIRLLMNGIKAYNLKSVLIDMRTGNGMYNRRGGLKYYHSLKSLYFYMYKNKFITWYDYIKIITCYFIVCIIPSKCRKVIYYKRLRKRTGL